ncbi:MAG: hypothetical protein WEB58_01110 [Planctomycetaceae bacterium]
MDSQTIISLVGKVTGRWAKQRKAEERHANAITNRRFALLRQFKTTLKEVVNEHVEAAYLAVSSNNTLPAHARQLMYDVRRRIQASTDEPLNDAYFTQTLLPTFMRENSELTAAWDVVFDARGHFHEPHTRVSVALGTLAVRQHLRGSSGTDEAAYEPDDLYPTHGPEHRYGAILFVEKEGFMPLFEKVKLAERFDVALMSTKGQSVIASRQLVDHLCGRHNIPLLVLHDFDKSGFSICGTLSRSSDRYRFRHQIQAIDLGLRLQDVERWHLESETFATKMSARVMRANLMKNGATRAEADFIAEGQRVELNAFTSGDLVSFLEAKLTGCGVKKIVPAAETLEAAYRRALKDEFIRERFDELKLKADACVAAARIPGLQRRVAKTLKDNPSLPWDEAVRRIASDAFDTERRGDS